MGEGEIAGRGVVMIMMSVVCTCSYWRSPSDGSGRDQG